ncbi:MAG: signal peptide peptidase SppA [Chthoniobacteraceae bacterium]
MNNKSFGCLGIGLVVLLVLSLVLNFIFILAGSSTIATSAMGVQMQPPRFEEGMLVPGKGGSSDKIAVIYLRGIISGLEPGAIGDTMVEDMKLQLAQAVADEKVKAIVLHIDSPGGEVTASDTIYNAVRRARDKKSVVVYMGSLAASGGYYVACGAKWLVANETTFTGSIGVIMQSINFEQLMGKVGVSTITYKSGKMKDMLTGTRQPTEEEKAYLQALIMQTYGKFVGIVAKERNLPEQALRDGIADGRVVSGTDALAAKLVDQLGEVEDAYAKAKELGKADAASIIRYEAPFKLGRLLRILGKSDARQAKVEVDLAKSFGPRLEAGKLYFLPSFYAP